MQILFWGSRVKSFIALAMPLRSLWVARAVNIWAQHRRIPAQWRHQHRLVDWKCGLFHANWTQSWTPKKWWRKEKKKSLVQEMITRKNLLGALFSGAKNFHDLGLSPFVSALPGFATSPEKLSLRPATLLFNTVFWVQNASWMIPWW